MDVHIRWMIRRDMPEVLKIENSCFDYPWSESDFIDCLTERTYVGMVAEVQESIVGYMIYKLNLKSIDVINLAVLPEYWRKGVGTSMVQKLIGKLSHNRRTKLELEIRESNLKGQLFFKHSGFKATSIVSNIYTNYTDCKDDAYVMEYNYETPANNIVKILKARQGIICS